MRACIPCLKRGLMNEVNALQLQTMGVEFSGQAACTAKDSRAARALRRSRLGPLRCCHWRERASPFRILHTYDPRLTLVIPKGLGFRASKVAVTQTMFSLSTSLRLGRDSGYG